MIVKYFKETDTALIEFSSQPVEQTHAIGENVYLDLDKQGNLVSMTIEHAQRNTRLPNVVVERFDQGAA